MSGESLQVWIAALEENYVEAPAWQYWTEQMLLKSDPVAPWLVDLYEAQDTQAALAALSDGLRELERKVGWRAAAPLNATGLRLGFLWLRHKRGDLNLADTLLRAGEVADCANYNNPGCEAFYLLLNELEGRGPAGESPGSLLERAEALFAQHAALGRSLLIHLRGPAPQ